MEQVVITVIPFLAAAVVKATAILLAALAATLLLRRRSAALRHFVWSVAIVCTVAIPLLGIVPPIWHLSVPVVGQMPHLPLATPTNPAEILTPEPHIYVDEPESRFAQESPRPARNRSPWPVPSVPDLIFDTWLTGAFIVLLQLTVGIVRVRKVITRSRPVSGRLLTIANEVFQQINLRRTPKISISTDADSILSPITYGAWYPAVVLSKASEDWSDEHVRSVFLHEASHIQRQDWTAQVAAHVCCAIYWFNPLIWIASKQLRREAERASDDGVLRAGVKPSQYAQNLVDIVRSMPASHRRSHSPATLAMAEPSEVAARLQDLLNKNISRQPLKRKVIAAAILCLTVVIVPLACGQITAMNTPSANLDEELQAGGGGTVKLLLISNAYSKSSQWWDYKGKAIPVTDQLKRHFKGLQVMPAANHTVYRLLFSADLPRSDGDPEIDLDDLEGSCATICPASNVDETNQIAVDVPLPASSALEAKIGLTTGPWATAETLTNNYGQSVNSPTTGLSHFACSTSPIYMTQNGAILTATASADQKFAMRIIGIDAHNHTVVPENTVGGPDGKFVQITATFPKSFSLKTRKEIDIQVDPYTYFDFKNIPAQPLFGATPSASAVPLARQDPGTVQLLEQARQMVTSGQRGAKLIAVLRQAVAADPSSADAKFDLGNALFLNDSSTFPIDTFRYTKAPPREASEGVELMKAAIAEQPTNIMYHQALASCYFADKQLANAASEFRASLSLLGPVKPFNIEAKRSIPQIDTAGMQFNILGNLGAVYLAEDQYTDSLNVLQLALKFDPHSAWILVDLGDALNGCGRRAEAIDDWQRCVALEQLKPNNHSAMLTSSVSRARRHLQQFGNGS